MWNLYVLLSLVIYSSQRITRSMLDDDPCLDAQEVSDVSAVKFRSRFADLERPWIRSDVSPKIYTSHGLHYQWLWVKSLPIQGLHPSKTIDDVISWMESKNCSFLARGQAVWQTVQRSHPLSVSAETSCSIPMLYEQCQHKFGPTSCALFPMQNDDVKYFRLEIGDATSNSSLDVVRSDPIHLYPWGTFLLQPPRKWAYTMDTMAIYDNQAGQVYLIDMTGRSYQDVCEKKIAAPDEEHWQEWAENDPDKLFEFYKMRSMGFSSGNSAFHDFINRHIKLQWTKKSAQKFYCESLLGGILEWPGDKVTSACHVVYPDVKKIAQIKEILKNELGSIWYSDVGPAVEDMEAIYVTKKKFYDVRNRIYHRMDLGAFNVSTTEYVGETLVQDISEVHRRPIMSKDEADSPLPKEFSPVKLVPDDRGIGFVEKTTITETPPELALSSEVYEPEGAGYNNLETYDVDAYQPDKSSEHTDYETMAAEHTNNARLDENSSLIFLFSFYSFYLVTFVSILC